MLCKTVVLKGETKKMKKSGDPGLLYAFLTDYKSYSMVSRIMFRVLINNGWRFLEPSGINGAVSKPR